MRLPFFSVMVMLILALPIDYYILRRANSIKKRSLRLSLKTLAWIFTIIGFGLLGAILCMPVRGESTEMLPVMWMLYTFLSIFIPKLVFVVFSLLGTLIKHILKGSNHHNKLSSKSFIQKIFSIVGLVVGVAICITMWWGVLFTRNKIEVNTVDIRSDRIPAAFNGFKIVQFSDAHVGTWGTDTTFIASLVDRINCLKPDLVVFTGDIVSRRSEELIPFISVLKRITAPYGVYSVLGNHDYGDYIDWKNESAHKKNNELLASMQKSMGWHLLNNEHVFVKHGNDSIVLLGVENWGEAPFPEYGKLRSSYPESRDSVYNLNDNRYKILLTHNPEHWSREVSKISNIDLSLSGHTHAMQMMISAGSWKWSPSGWKYPRWGGLYDSVASDGNKMYLYVNIGAGEVGIPSRIGSAYPEITEFILHDK